jgi:hypothetical protein
MMGQLKRDQGHLSYSFYLDEVVPDDHLVRTHLGTCLGQRTFKCKRTIGTRSAQSIRIGGHTCRINRPHT